MRPLLLPWRAVSYSPFSAAPASDPDAFAAARAAAAEVESSLPEELRLPDAPLVSLAAVAQRRAHHLLQRPAPLGEELRARSLAALQTLLGHWQQFEQPPPEALDALSELLEGPLASQLATGGAAGGVGELDEDGELCAMVQDCVAHFADPAALEQLGAADPPARSAFIGTLGLAAARVLCSCELWAAQLLGAQPGVHLLTAVACWPQAPLRARLAALQALERATRFPAGCAAAVPAAPTLAALLLANAPESLCEAASLILRRLRVRQLCQEPSAYGELAAILRSRPADHALLSLLSAVDALPSALCASPLLRRALEETHEGLTLLALAPTEAHGDGGDDVWRCALLGVPALHALLSGEPGLASLVWLARSGGTRRRAASTLLCAPGAVEALLASADVPPPEVDAAMVAQQHAFEALEALMGDARGACLDAWLPFAARLAALPASPSSAVCAVRELAAAARAYSADAPPEAAALQLLPAILSAVPPEAARVPVADGAPAEEPVPAAPHASGAHEGAWRGALVSLRLLRLRCASSPLACSSLLGADALGLCARVLSAAADPSLSPLELLEEMKVGTALAAARRAHRSFSMSAEAALLAGALLCELRDASTPARNTALLRAAVAAHAAASQAYVLHGAAADAALAARRACAALCELVPGVERLLFQPPDDDPAPPVAALASLVLLGDLRAESVTRLSCEEESDAANAMALGRLVSSAASSVAVAPAAAASRLLSRLDALGGAASACASSAVAHARATCDAEGDADSAARLELLLHRPAALAEVPAALLPWRAEPDEEAAKRRRVLRAEVRTRQLGTLERPPPPPRKPPALAALSRTIHVDEFQAREAAAKQQAEEREEEAPAPAAPPPPVPAPPAAAAAPRMLSIRFGGGAPAPAAEQQVDAEPEPELDFEAAFGDAAPAAPAAPAQPAFIPGLGAAPVIPGVGAPRAVPGLQQPPGLVQQPQPPPGLPPGLQQPRPPPGFPPGLQQPRPPPGPPPGLQQQQQPVDLQQLLSAPSAIEALLHDPARLRLLLEQFPALASVLQTRLAHAQPR